MLNRKAILAGVFFVAVFASGLAWYGGLIPGPDGPPPRPIVQPRLLSEAATPGERQFLLWCSGCHEPMPGAGIDPPLGTYVLEDRYQGIQPAALEQRTDLLPDYIRLLVRRGINNMPAFRKTEISDEELGQIVEYLTRNNPADREAN